MTWTPPDDAVCIVPGCTLAPAGTRPASQSLLLVSEDGPMVATADTINEITCAVHLEGDQPA